MKVVELFNAHPPEYFLQQHLRSVEKNPDLDVIQGYWQESFDSSLFTKNSFVFFNPNRNSRSQKLKRFILNGGAGSSDRFNIGLVERYNPDLIHFQFAPLAQKLSWLPKQLGKPYFFSLRGSETYVSAKVDEEFANGIHDLSKGAAGIHAVTSSILDEFSSLAGYEHPNSMVIPTYVDSQILKPSLKEGKVKFLFVGRLNFVKGVQDLIIALSILEKEYADFELKIVGGGDEKAAVEYLVLNEGLMDKVHLVGEISHDDLLQEYKKSSALIISSLSEGFPNVFAEAVLAGLPVISTTIPGVLDHFSPEKDFIPAQMGSPESLSSALKRFVSTPSKGIEGMVLSAQEKVRVFQDSESHSNSFLNLWETGLGSGLSKVY